MNYVYSIQDPQLKNYFPELAKNLIALNSAGFELINGFIISKEVISKLLKDLKLEDLWIESLSRLNVAKMQSQDLEKFSLESQKRINTYQFDENLKEEVSKAYSNISGFLDSGIAIYQIVNMQDIVVKDLNIKGIEEIFESLKTILLDEFVSEKVLSNFHSGNGIFDFQDDFLILKSVQPEVSGFAYNFELINNLKDKFTIEAIFGLNTLLENKSVIPDQYIWDLEESRVSEKFLSKQVEMEILVSSKEKTKIIPISKSWQDRQKLDDKYISKLVEKLKILDNEFNGRLFRLKWAFESGKIYGLGIEEFYSNLNEHKLVLQNEPEKNIEKPIIYDEVNSKLNEQKNNLDQKENLGLNIFEKIFKTNQANKKTEETLQTKSIFENNYSTIENKGDVLVENTQDLNQSTKVEFKDKDNVISNFSKSKFVENPKFKYEGKSAFEILYPNKPKPKNLTENLDKVSNAISSPLSKPLNTELQTKVNVMNIAKTFTQNIIPERNSDLNSKISDIQKSKPEITNFQNNKFQNQVDKAEKNEILDQNKSHILEHNSKLEIASKSDNKELKSNNEISSETNIQKEVETKKEQTITEQTQKKISSNIKTATKVYLNLHGESNLNVSDILSSDGAIIGFDYKNLDIEGLSVVLSNNSQLYNPKPIIYQIGGLSKYTKYTEEIPLEVEKQFSSVLTARNLEGNKNLNVMINTIKTTDEYLNIKKFISSIGLRRSANFKIYLSLDNLAAFHNLQNILEDGVDGIFINLEELSRFAVGSNQNDVFQIYDIETIGILNLLKDAVNLSSKSKVPVFVNISTLAGEKLEYNLKKILQLGIYGVQTSRSNLVNVKEILSKLELENLFKL